uniref:Fibrillar collagen NC1 domain-containing protein n=2 Tax=Scleropages formosus TaxID=113540 RepID=A0A8D0CCC3_SCLFO
MKFLHLLSTEATQSVTVHSPSAPGPSATRAGSQPSDLRFKGWNGQTFDANTLLETRVLLDNCETEDGHWHQSRFLFRTQDSHQLPVVDLREPAGIHLDLQQRRLEVGPVCFV